VQIARELVRLCRSLTRTILVLDRDLQQRANETAPVLLALPGCGAISFGGTRTEGPWVFWRLPNQALSWEKEMLRS